MLFSSHQTKPFSAEVSHLSGEEKKSRSRKYGVVRTLDLRVTRHFRSLLALHLFALLDGKEAINQLHLCEKCGIRRNVLVQGTHKLCKHNAQHKQENSYVSLKGRTHDSPWQ